MKQKLFFGKIITPTIIVFVIMLTITQIVAYKIYTIEKTNELELAEKEATHIKQQIETSLNHSVTAAKMIAFLVEKNLITDNFDAVSKDLLQQNKFIDALQLLEGSTIIKTYPLKGNEAAIGLNIFSNPNHKKEAIEAIKRKELYFEGPINLKQGGKAIVGRLPIYKDNKFLGFSAIIIKMKTLFNILEINENGENDQFIYQIYKASDNTEHNFFFNHNEKMKEGLFYQVFVRLGNWNVLVKLKSPNYLYKSLPFSLLGILFSCLLAYIVFTLSIQPIRLKQDVKRKTRELNRLNKMLESRANELAISNSELEQFAYVASHDLQEPLRMVTSFLSQLEKKYSNQLDEKAHMYIDFAVDGASRMRNIILDLLEYSRVGKNNDELEPININEVVEQAKVLLRKVIEEKEAIIVYDKLPTIMAYRSPIVQVFQNLIGNGLKYAKADLTPIIDIKAKELKNEWEFAIKDNGIGIKKDYYEKIFVIFQRLHNRDEYSGTGMGLAIVKKIVENLGGKIWLESEEGKGSTFYFTLPQQI
ncbi:MAG: ATP-binding protein [Flavobacteriales bacterium]|jgi:signal transduction histidine kinase|nr:CHASE domain-containing protein [Flavobacteriales bacterium]